MGTARVGTGRVGTARVGTARVGTAHVGTAHVGTARVGTARVGTWQQVGGCPKTSTSLHGLLYTDAVETTVSLCGRPQRRP